MVDEDGKACAPAARLSSTARARCTSRSPATRIPYRPGDPRQAHAVSSPTSRANRRCRTRRADVDEAVSGLIDARPGWLRSISSSRTRSPSRSTKSKARSRFRAARVQRRELGQGPDRARAAQVEAEAKLAALQGQSMMGIHVGELACNVASVHAKVAPFYHHENQARLIKLLKPIVDKKSGARRRPPAAKRTSPIARAKNN